MRRIGFITLAALFPGAATAQVAGLSCATGSLGVCFSTYVTAAWDASGSSLVQLQVVDPFLELGLSSRGSPIRTMYVDLHVPGGIVELTEPTAMESLGEEGYVGIRDAWGWSSVYRTPFRCLGCTETGDIVPHRTVGDLMDAIFPSLLFVVLLVTQLLRPVFHHSGKDLRIESSPDGRERLHHV
jgi:hypothetical protein